MNVVAVPSRVDVFWLRAGGAWDAQPLRAVLTPVESERIRTWNSMARVREFILGRALLRLAGRAWALAGDWLALDDSGRPRVAGAVPGVDVSLSHAGDHVVVALARGGRVGVDVALHEPRERSLMDRFFHDDELAWMGTDLQRLHRAWTLKEAALKALGTGVQGDPRRVHLSVESDALTVDGAGDAQPWCAYAARDGASGGVVLLREPGTGIPSLSLHAVEPRQLLDLVQPQPSPGKTA